MREYLSHLEIPSLTKWTPLISLRKRVVVMIFLFVMFVIQHWSAFWWLSRQSALCGGRERVMQHIRSSCYYLPVVPVSFRQNQREQEIENDFAFVDAVAGNVGHKPMPKLRQGPANNMMSSLVINQVYDTDKLQWFRVEASLAHFMFTCFPLILSS